MKIYADPERAFMRWHCLELYMAGSFSKEVSAAIWLSSNRFFFTTSVHRTAFPLAYMLLDVNTVLEMILNMNMFTALHAGAPPLHFLLLKKSLSLSLCLNDKFNLLRGT
jgi:hypothetical protein